MALSTIADIFIGASIFLIACGGLFMNVQLLLKMKKRASENPDEKINKLYLSTAITHVLLIFTIMPLSSSSSLTRTWLWGDAGCTYYGFMGNFLGNAMIFQLLLVCFDLCFVINFKDEDSSSRDRRNIIMLVAIWIIALLTAVPPIFGWSSYKKEPTGLSCTVVYIESEKFSYLTYICSLAIVVFFYPILMMIVCYFSIGVSAEEKSTEEKELISYYKKKILLFLILVLVEWGPYTLYYIWSIFSEAPVFLNAVSPLFCKTATVLTTYVLWDLVDHPSLKTKAEV